MGQDAALPRYRTRNGWAVKIVQLTCTQNHHDGSWIRLTHHGFFVADVRSPEALERYVQLADLEEALTGRRFRLSYSNHASCPSASRSRTSQKIHRLVISCRWATSSRYQPSTRRWPPPAVRVEQLGVGTPRLHHRPRARRISSGQHRQFCPRCGWRRVAHGSTLEHTCESRLCARRYHRTTPIGHRLTHPRRTHRRRGIGLSHV